MLTARLSRVSLPGAADYVRDAYLHGCCWVTGHAPQSGYTPQCAGLLLLARYPVEALGHLAQLAAAQQGLLGKVRCTSKGGFRGWWGWLEAGRTVQLLHT